MTDFRALCAELVDAWDDLPWEYDFKGNITGIHGDLYDDSAIDRARAALAESDGPAVSGDREPASVATQASDQLYVLFASLEWKLGCHMAEWKAARELAYRHGKAGDDLNQAHCDGVVRLLRDHLEAYGA